MVSETVEGVAKSIGKEVIIEEGFKERILAAKPVEDFTSAIKKVWDEPTFHWEGGESNVTAQMRGLRLFLIY